jgi:hypothetical protein
MAISPTTAELLAVARQTGHDRLRDDPGGGTGHQRGGHSQPHRAAVAAGNPEAGHQRGQDQDRLEPSRKTMAVFVITVCNSWPGADGLLGLAQRASSARDWQRSPPENRGR